MFGEGMQFVDGGSKLAVQEVDRKAEVVAHLGGLPQAFRRVALEAEPVSQCFDAIA
jgi:hypothetical protein